MAFPFGSTRLSLIRRLNTLLARLYAGRHFPGSVAYFCDVYNANVQLDKLAATGYSCSTHYRRLCLLVHRFEYRRHRFVHSRAGA